MFTEKYNSYPFPPSFNACTPCTVFFFHFMRFSLVFIVLLCLYVCKCSGIFTCNPTPPLDNFYHKSNIYPKKLRIEIKGYNIFQILILVSAFFSLLWMSLLQLCNHVKYVTFNTNLCTRLKETTTTFSDCFCSYSSLTMLGLLFCECPDYPLLIFIISINPSYASYAINLTLKFSKILSWSIFSILSIYIFSIALTPATCILSLAVF